MNKINIPESFENRSYCCRSRPGILLSVTALKRALTLQIVVSDEEFLVGESTVVCDCR